MTVIKGIKSSVPTPKQIMNAALGYAKKLMWPVIPLHSVIDGKCTCNKGINCSSPGKHPRISNWQEHATTELEIIYRWFSSWQYSNIGIVTGEKSGFFVLDVDTKHNGLFFASRKCRKMQRNLHRLAADICIKFHPMILHKKVHFSTGNFPQ